MVSVSSVPAEGAEGGNETKTNNGVVQRESDILQGAANIAKRQALPSSQQRSDSVKVNLKSKHIPVITAYNLNIKQIANIIDQALGHCNYTMKIMSRNATNIGVCTLEDFEKVRAIEYD